MVGSAAGALGAGYGYVAGSGSCATAGGLAAVAGSAVVSVLNPAYGIMSLMRGAAVSSVGGVATGGIGGWAQKNFGS